MRKIRIILTVFFMLIFISACSQKQEEQIKTSYTTSSAEKWAEEYEGTKPNTYSTYYELEDILSDYGYYSIEEYVRDNYSVWDIWDNIYDIEDEIKEEVFETGLIEKWYDEYCSDDYDYYRN